MDLYNMFQNDGVEVIIVRLKRNIDQKTGAIQHEKQIDTIWAAEIPPTIGLRQAKTSYAEASAFLLLDTFYYNEHPLYPFSVDDWVIYQNKAYTVSDIGTGQDNQETLLALRLPVGAVPFNLSELALT